MECTTNPKLRHEHGDVLVEGIEDDFGYPLVAPSSMNQQELAQISELPDSNIGAPCCLQAFYAADAHANVCRLDHGHIVGTITDGQEE